MIIDAHGHVHDPVGLHLDALDAAGVDRAVLFPTRPHPERAGDLPSLRREFAVLDGALGGRGGTREAFAGALDEVTAAVAAHPERFVGFGSVPLELPAEEVERAVAEDVVGRGLCGIGELTPAPGRAGRLEPVLRAAADHGGLPVVVHGFAPTTAEDLRTLAALSRRHPGVPLIVSQLGGLHWMEAVELVRDTPGMYLELSTAFLVIAVRLAVRELPERTLFGSDAPYGDPVVARVMVERATASGEIRDRVLGGTAAEVFRLPR
ncbi:amidohydrolase family protein [Streptomyces cinerochromogenes]|uniref:amidohydrolase family protein n=1 Tax=Streptomyces cinerochromogenes TaxID=66422 RepID=UPI00166FAA87|nr:amidohydrolase family protein [Streptomyces cinerochromogenes]GGS78460.1 amidohydrolase [Streptomyces cinerochromogenes]